MYSVGIRSLTVTLVAFLVASVYPIKKASAGLDLFGLAIGVGVAACATKFMDLAKSRSLNPILKKGSPLLHQTQHSPAKVSEASRLEESTPDLWKNIFDMLNANASGFHTQGDLDRILKEMNARGGSYKKEAMQAFSAGRRDDLEGYVVAQHRFGTALGNGYNTIAVKAFGVSPGSLDTSVPELVSKLRRFQDTIDLEVLAEGVTSQPTVRFPVDPRYSALIDALVAEGFVKKGTSRVEHIAPFESTRRNYQHLELAAPMKGFNKSDN